MMRPVHYTYTGSGRGQPIPLDRYVNGFTVGVTLNPNTMKINYTLKYSIQDPEYKTTTKGNNGIKVNTPWVNSFKTSATWFNSDDPVMVNQSAARTSNFAFPPTAVLLSATAVSGGTAYLHIIPMGMDE